jgi:hypothetical protein
MYIVLSVIGLPVAEMVVSGSERIISVMPMAREAMILVMFRVARFCVAKTVAESESDVSSIDNAILRAHHGV